MQIRYSFFKISSFLFLFYILSFFPTYSIAQSSVRSLTNEATELFAGSGICAQCHSSLYDEAGNNVSIDSHWKSTMMANASRDPLWQAKVNSEVSRNPKLQSIIEDKCATCHMPMARTQMKQNGKDSKISNNGFLNMNNPLHEIAMDGVSCTLCHQIREDNFGSEKSFSGNYTIDNNQKKPARHIYGPYKNPFGNPMRNMSGFTPVFGKNVGTSELCAICHTLFTPTIDANGEIAGYFPEQTPYLEWKNSIFSAKGTFYKACQDCHMPEAEGKVVISNRPGNLRARSPFSDHIFVGGNAFMLTLFKVYQEKLGIIADDEHLDFTKDQTIQRLQNETAEVKINTIRSIDSQLEITVKVINKAGHKFPTGFPSRRAWIHLQGKDAEGKIFFESGNFNREGAIIGNDADQNDEKYEIHYDLIDNPDKVQIYEGIMRDIPGDVTYTLLEAESFVKDNRLYPKGFDKHTKDNSISVVGKAANDNNFTDNTDIVTYRMSIKGFKKPYSISVELLYQTLSYNFYKDLIKDNEISEVIRESDRYNTPVVVSEHEMKF